MKTKQNGKKLKVAILLLFSFSLATIQVYNVLADSEITLTGTVQIGNAPISVTSVEIVNSTYDVVTSWLPNNTDIFGVNTTVSDANTLLDLKNITWYIFDDSVHGQGGADDWNSLAPNGYDLITVSYNESDDLWSIDQGAFTHWTIQDGVGDDCTDVGCGTVSTFEFSAQFDISYAALAATDMNVTVIAYDDSESTDSDVSSLFTMSSFFVVTVDDNTILWGTVDSLSFNNTADPNNRTITISANADFEIQLKADDMTASAESDVDLDLIDAVTWDEDGVVGGNSFFFRNTYTTGLGTWDAQSALGSETNVTRLIHFWFTDTGDFASGKTWTCIMYVLLQADV